MPTLTASTTLVRSESFPRTKRKSPVDVGLQQWFEAKASEFPKAVAVSFPENSKQQEISYGELNFRANQLARHLRKAGVGPDVVVGICAERSFELIVAALAVIKAGGAYLPLDPTYPKERLSFMLEDTSAPIILTQEKLAPTLPKNDAHLLCLDTDWKAIAKEPGENLDCIASHDHLAYLIYTSGSTGKPKGVAMRHGPLVNLLLWQFQNWSARPDAKTLQFASLNFDVSFQEIFSTLGSGGTLVLVSEELRRDSNRLLNFLDEQQVERIFLPFVALKHLADASEREQIFPRQLREVITAGEQLQITPQVTRFFSKLPRCTLHNQYGPSETHVVTAFDLKGSPQNWPALPSIGKAIFNTQIFILDEQLRPVEPGTPGELFIGGDCLARGYLNRPELTAEKFIASPFAQNSRLYKTGDLARQLPDGNFEFLGRIDHQVKIRGFRIELGEIETVLSQHPAIREVVVVAKESANSDKKLVAYIVANPGAAATSSELRKFLTNKIPSYAVPSIFMQLPAFPLTPNGKVDRRALPEPVVEEDFSAQIKPPQSPLEMQLQLVFEKFLNRRPIGIDVSFFELGGDSLQALKLIVEIERFTGKKLPLEILFQNSTIESLATYIQNSSGDFKFSSMVPLQPLGNRPPLFFIHTTPGDVLAYGALIYHLGLDQPCYGFQSLGFGRKEESHTRVDQMAAYYIKQLRTIQPHGPYYLSGWCYGGIVAVEMGHQLLAAGEEVALMALIETPAPAPAPAKSNFRFYVRRIGCLLKMSPRQWRIYLAEKIKYYRGVKRENEMRFRRVDQSENPDKIDEINQHLEQLEHVYHTNLDALNSYNVRPYPRKVVLFNAQDQDPAQVIDPLYGWPSLASQIEVHSVSGNHDTILMEPHVRQLAEKFSDCLVRSQH